jgi:signal transduction histidine kinase
LPNRKINCLLPVGSRDVWVGTDSGVVRWNGMELTLAGVPSALQHTQVLAMIRDRQSNLWIGTASGLCRINSQGISFSDEPHNQPASAITALFEDREGNLWVGGPQGLQRYREYAFLTYRQSYSGGPLYTDAQGRTWFAPSEGGLYWLKGTQIEAINDAGLNADVVYSIAGRSGELWLGRQRKGLTRLHYERGSLQSQTFTEAQGLSQNSVAAVYRSRDGTVWAGTVSGGLSRLNNGKFTTYTTANGLSSNTISAIEEDAGGSMYFATPNGLNVFRDGHWRAYTSNDGLPPASVNCLSEGANALLWIGTGKGLACLSSGRVQVPARMPGLLYEEILGVAEDNGGWLWIATPNHILEVKRAAILRGIVEDADVREFGSADGLRETQTVKRDRSVVRDSLGRIWFSMNRAISVVDPAELASISVPTLVHIRAISGDDRTIKMGASIRIPAGCQRVTFSYAGLNLSAPEQVRFRYKLDGVDGSWSAPTATPEAAYNNLSWGSYRFHVMASNSDGLWNSRPAVVDFEVNPAYWQRWWFWLACLAGFLMSARALFRYRMQHLTRQLNVRFEERLAERTRIAQELHDTLLQGVLSASMQLHVAVDRLPVDSPAKLSFNRVLQLMGQVIDEGRNAIRGLRSSDFGSLNLEDSLLSVRQALDVEDSVGFRVIVEGRPRQLNPILRDEIYRIGREALVNAFRHSGADLVEVELEYAPNSFRMLVRDNGCGIDPTVLRSGREGHWGLSGMRERAEIIGARLNLWSSATAGTEVELVLPQRVAYQPDGSNGSGWRLFGLLRR